MSELNKPLILLVCDLQYEKDYRTIVESLDCKVTTMSEEFAMHPESWEYSALSSDFLRELIQDESQRCYMVVIDYSYGHLLPALVKSGYKGAIILVGITKLEGATELVPFFPLEEMPGKLRQAIRPYLAIY